MFPSLKGSDYGERESCFFRVEPTDGGKRKGAVRKFPTETHRSKK